MSITTSEYIKGIDFESFRTYSFQRNGDYNILSTLDEKRKTGARLDKQESEVKNNLEPLSNTLYSSRILDKAKSRHNSAELISEISKGSKSYEALIEIMHTDIEEVMYWMCAPIYRDAILFYSSNNELIDGLNICFECDQIETINGEHISADFKVFKYLKIFLLELGHKVENPNNFKADELINWRTRK